MSIAEPNYDNVANTEISEQMEVDIYMPAFRDIQRRAGLPEDVMSSLNVTIPTKLFLYLLTREVKRLPFNENDYCAANPDVAAAAEAGTIPSLHLHFINTGWFEGRSAGNHKIDEVWYAANYRDVAIALRRGWITSFEAHFNEAGRSEGRVGSASQLDQKLEWDMALG